MIASLLERNSEYCLAAVHDEQMAMPVDAREGYAVYARLQLVKTISEAHGSLKSGSTNWSNTTSAPRRCVRS